jgi:hypothetical protein
MGAVCSFEIFGSFQIKWYYNPEDHTLEYNPRTCFCIAVIADRSSENDSIELSKKLIY